MLHRYIALSSDNLGSEFVEWMITNELKTRLESIKMGEQLMTQGLFLQVTKPIFEDSKDFYRLKAVKFAEGSDALMPVSLVVRPSAC